jgi:HAD superfamily hydrolase (TIGR01509 family)
MVEAVIFDLDGVLLDSEQLWNEAKREVVEETGGRWRDGAPEAMMGMSSLEWSAYLRDALGVPLEAPQIDRRVVGRMEDLYRDHLPLLPGAVDAVRALHRRWPLGLASSSNREIIELVLTLTRLRECFTAVVSSEEVARGKPSPDVYVEAARQLSEPPVRCVAIEDSANGLRSAAAAEMTVIAVPNRVFPPAADALALAAAVVERIGEVTPALIERVAGG